MISTSPVKLGTANHLLWRISPTQSNVYKINTTNNISTQINQVHFFITFSVFVIAVFNVLTFDVKFPNSDVKYHI